MVGFRMAVEVVPKLVEVVGDGAVRGFGLRWHGVPMVCDVRNLPTKLGNLECAELWLRNNAFALQNVDGASWAVTLSDVMACDGAT